MVYHCFASFKQSPLDFFKIAGLELNIRVIVWLSKSYNQWGSPITYELLWS